MRALVHTRGVSTYIHPVLTELTRPLSNAKEVKLKHVHYLSGLRGKKHASETSGKQLLIMNQFVLVPINHWYT